MSYPLHLVAEQDQLQIVHGYDVAPVKSDRGMFMRTVVPLQQAVVVDEQTSHRLLDVSNRVPPDSIRRSDSIRRPVGRNPRLKERMNDSNIGGFQPPDRREFSMNMVDSANKFYLFSISVIGLYMFYRVLQLSAESRK